MAEWTHRCCERCWFDGTEWLERQGESRNFELREVEPLGVINDGAHAGAYRMPTQVVDSEPGPCCVCGGMTITGIYFRRNETELRCLGRHEPEQLGQWSRVTLGQT